MIVAGSLAEIERTLDRTRTLIAVCALVAAVLAAGLATLLTRRALRPLTRLSAGARAIGRSGDASQRLPEPPAHDEVGELAGTLNAMLASLERAQEAEHRFVGDASHELRTPLTALRGNAAYLAKHGPDPAVIADIEAGAERLGELLDDLLALAREDAAAPLQGEPVRLADLAGRRDRQRDVTVRGERAALERAVDNLVRNAHKHGTGPRDRDRRRRRRGRSCASRTKAPGCRRTRPRRLRALLPRLRRARRGLRARAGDRPGDRRAPRRPRRGRRRALYARCQRTLKSRP